MKRSQQKKKKRSPALLDELSQVEQEIQAKGIKIRYERLEAGGLKLKSGLCRVKGQVYLFIDKRKSPQERLEILLDYALQDIPLRNIAEQIEPDGSNISRNKEPGHSGPRVADHER